MSKSKTYHDADGNECTLFKMVRHEPEWACSRITVGEEAADTIEQLTKELEASRARPKITNAMKANFIGEFEWQEYAPYYDESGNEFDLVATRTVPWDLCKRIYKEMATFASEH